MQYVVLYIHPPVGFNLPNILPDMYNANKSIIYLILLIMATLPVLAVEALFDFWSFDWSDSWISGSPCWLKTTWEQK